MIKTCKNCGKKASKVINTYFNQNGQYDHLFDKNFNYLGNEVVTKINTFATSSSTTIDSRTLGKNNEKVISFSTWDGQSYELKYDNFCTLRCATNFANYIVNSRT